MADILAAFEELDKEERRRNPKKAPRPTNTKYRNPLISNNSSSAQRPSQRQGRPRPRSLPPQNPSESQSRPGSTSPSNNNLLTPAHTDRSPSVASGRRISFVDRLPRPPSTQHRLRIPTKSASLASGFVYDPKLNKYSVSETEWADFSDAIIDQANLPRAAAWAWPFHRKDVIKRLKNQLQYEGSDIKRHLNAWNRSFKRKGFTVSMELPGEPRIHETDTEEQKKQARKEAKYFRMVVTPVAEKAGSIYSRTSSLTRTVSNEGMSLQPSKTSAEDDAEGGADEQKPQAEESESKEAEEEVKRELSGEAEEKEKE